MFINFLFVRLNRLISFLNSSFHSKKYFFILIFYIDKDSQTLYNIIKDMLNIKYIYKGEDVL
jgi:hypothetical protein